MRLRNGQVGLNGRVLRIESDVTELPRREKLISVTLTPGSNAENTRRSKVYKTREQGWQRVEPEIDTRRYRWHRV
jgi:hypothetical protein